MSQVAPESSFSPLSPAELVAAGEAVHDHIITHSRTAIQGFAQALSDVSEQSTVSTPHRFCRQVMAKMGVLHAGRYTREDFEGEVVIPSDIPQDAVVRVLLTTKRRFYRHTRLLPDEFFIVLEELSPVLQRPRKQLDGDEPGIGGRPRKLHPADELLLWIYHSDGNHTELLSILFGDIHPTTVDRIADHVTDVINLVYEEQLQWPDAEERKATYGYFSVHEKAVAVLDGTHCEIKVPTYDEDGYFSGYKGRHTQNYLLWVSALGFVLRVEGPYAGRQSDRGNLNESYYLRHEKEMLSEGEVVIADGGFLGDGQLILPPRTTDINDPANTKEEKDMMLGLYEEISDNRSLVERCIHVVKHRIQSLVDRFRRNPEKQHPLFLAACKLTNRVRLYRLQIAVSAQLS